MDIVTFQISQSIQINYSLIKEVREYFNSYFVIFEKGHGLRPRFVSKKEVLNPVQFTEYHKMLINVGLTAKLARLPKQEIKNTLVLEHGVVAIETSYDYQFLTINDYSQNFVESRKARKSQVEIDYSNGMILAVNRDNGHEYQLIATSKEIRCECKDYLNQRIAFGKGCCKHAYKLLANMGFDSLADYVLDEKREVSEYEERLMS